MEVYCACARETSTTSKKVEMTRGAFEQKNGPVQKNCQWRILYISGSCGLCKDVDVVTHGEDGIVVDTAAW
jgi:hypothetical protein